MHPQESDRFGTLVFTLLTPKDLTPAKVVCKELFQALEACHADKWRKWTGGCNSDKHELNMCLRKVVRLPLTRPYVSRLKSLGLVV